MSDFLVSDMLLIFTIVMYYVTLKNSEFENVLVYIRVKVSVSQ